MQLIDAKEASKMLGVRLPRLYELARLKSIPCVRLGEKQLRFDPELLRTWVHKESTLKTTIDLEEKPR